MSESTPPPGWHEDPYGTPGLLRWWDGRQWTETTTPAQDAPSFGGPPPVYTAPEPLYGKEPPYGKEPATAGRSRSLPWVLAGAVLAVIVAVVITVVVVDGGGDGEDHGGGPTASASSAPVTSPPAAAGRSPVIGTVTDTTAGISYARLGAPWTSADESWLRPDLFSAGQVSVVQTPFGDYASFNATSLSGVPRADESNGYTGPQNLSAVGRRVTARILREHFAMEQRRSNAVSAARTVDGHQAWLERFRLDFPEARERGWKFSADTIAILVVDVGGGHLAELWVSVPDTFPGQGDVDQILDSVKVSP